MANTKQIRERAAAVRDRIMRVDGEGESATVTFGADVGDVLAHLVAELADCVVQLTAAAEARGAGASISASTSTKATTRSKRTRNTTRGK